MKVEVKSPDGNGESLSDSVDQLFALSGVLQGKLGVFPTSPRVLWIFASLKEKIYVRKKDKVGG